MPQNPQSKIRPPSPRDLEIFNRIRVQNHPRWEVAHDHGLHQTRISQIVRRVERYLASGGSPTHPQLNDQQSQHRLARSLHKLRLLRALEVASAFLESPDDPIQKSRRRIVAGQEAWREESTAENPGARQMALQNYIAAVKALATLERNDQTQDTPAATAPPLTLATALPVLTDILCRFRIEAELSGQVESAPDAPSLVLTTLKQLLGQSAIPARHPSAHLAHRVSAPSTRTFATNPTQPTTSAHNQKNQTTQGAPQ